MAARVVALQPEEAVIGVEQKATDAATVEEIDRRFVFHPFTQLDQHEQTGSPSVIVEGHGARLRDIHGRSYIDAMAGLWCVNVGYGRRRDRRRAAASTPSGSATTTRSRRWARTRRRCSPSG